MKLTGERPMQGATPDSLLAFHDAGYREVVARLGPGIVRRRRLRRRRRDPAPRRPGSARDRRRLQRARRCSSRRVEHAATDGLRFFAFDGAALGARATRSVDYIVSSHIIEHFTNPVPHVAELAARAAARRHRVRHHAERARRLREPVPRVPVRARATRLAALALLRRGRRASASRATTRCTPTSRARRESGERLLRLDVLQLRKRIPRARLRVDVRARAADRVPPARQRAHRHRLGPLGGQLLRHRAHRRTHAGTVRDRAAVRAPRSSAA